MLRCCLRWTDRSAAALRTCLPFSAPAESCERVPATVVFPAFRRTQIITYAPRRSTPRCRFPTYWSDHRARLSSHATCTSLPPPQPSGRRLHAAACTPPARRLRRLRPGATHAGVISLRPSWRVWRGVYLPGPGASDCGFLRKRGAVDLSLPEWPELVAKAP